MGIHTSFGKHRTTSGRGDSKTNYIVVGGGGGTCSLLAGLIDDPYTECQFIHDPTCTVNYH